MACRESWCCEQTYTKSGRLVLNDELNPNNGLVTDFLAQRDVSAQGATITASMGSTAAVATHDIATKTTSVNVANISNANENIRINYPIADMTKIRSANGASVNLLDWTMANATLKYSMDLTISDLAPIQGDVPVFSHGGGVADNTSPGLVFYMNDAKRNSNARYKALTFAIYNKAGQLYATACDSATSYAQQVALGVAPSETEFSLDFYWAADGKLDIYVNNAYKGTIQSDVTKQGFSSRNPFYLINVVAGKNYADGKIVASVQNLTFEYSCNVGAMGASDDYVPAIKYYQTSPVVDGTYNVRLIATVDKALVDAGEMIAAGFNVQASKTNTEGTVNGVMKSHKVYEVYTKITADGLEVTAPDGTYFLVFTVKGIPTADTITLNFSAFAETAEASYVEGSTFALTFANGAVVKK